jgi:hypothetical protein
MKLRWKHFLVLVAASLVPLLAVTWITQNASRRLGKTISERAQNTLTDTVRQEMVRATRSYAAFSHLGGVGKNHFRESPKYPYGYSQAGDGACNP